MRIEAPISLGELVDKMTILEIKQVEIKDAVKRGNVNRELQALNDRLDEVLDPEGLARLEPFKRRLREINEVLWKIEDDIRDCERGGDFSDTFVQLARSVYQTNDQRAHVKKEINEAFGSELVEEKSYQPYN